MRIPTHKGVNSGKTKKPKYRFLFIVGHVKVVVCLYITRNSKRRDSPYQQPTPSVQDTNMEQT